MQNRQVTGLAMLLLLLGLGLGYWMPGKPTAASQSSGRHQIVGSWGVRLEDDGTPQAPSLSVFTSDGTVLNYDPSGSVAVGSWAVLSDRAVQFTGYTSAGSESQDCDGGQRLGGVAEAGDAGEQITMAYTVQCFDETGTMVNERGPIWATGSRIEVEDVPQPVATVLTP